MSLNWSYVWFHIFFYVVWAWTICNIFTVCICTHRQPFSRFAVSTLSRWKKTNQASSIKTIINLLDLTQIHWRHSSLKHFVAFDAHAACQFGLWTYTLQWSALRDRWGLTVSQGDWQSGRLAFMFNYIYSCSRSNNKQ